VNAFAQTLAAAAQPRLQEKLSTTKIGCVSTERPTSKGRYDIVLRCDDLEIVIENKTKSLGAAAQLGCYEGENTLCVPLGLSELSFCDETRKRYPGLTYEHINQILNKLQVPNDDFGVLIRHYKEFLERELGILAAIREFAVSKSGSSPLRNAVLRNANDRRFVNWYYLALFREQLRQSKLFRGSEWTIDKNMKSGVWLANFKELPTSYKFSGKLKNFCKAERVALWFHIELWDGIAGESDESEVGLMQLRCEAHRHSKDSNQAAFDAFEAIHHLGSAEKYPRAIKAGANTFCLVKRTLKKHELPFSRLERMTADFHRRFGEFMT